jgi:hypothetical protein
LTQKYQDDSEEKPIEAYFKILSPSIPEETEKPHTKFRSKMARPQSNAVNHSTVTSVRLIFH